MSVTLDPRSERAVAEEVEKVIENVRRAIIGRLMHAGEQAVNKARLIVTAEGASGAGKAYTVRTGNLTSSIGYCVTENGNIVTMSSFDTVKDGGEGASKGMAYAKQLATQFPTGYALIIVAGMHYASYVQELYGYDVIASATQLAEQLVSKLKEKFQ